METYNRFKRMKKSTKVGLVSSAVYVATSFALPVFANTVEQPVFQPVDVKQITTVEQAENIYNTKLAEYAQDKKITTNEITQLGEIKWKVKSILEEQVYPLGVEKSKLTEKIGKLDKGIQDYEKKLEILDNQLQHPNVKKSLEETLERFEKEILTYYPGLVNKDKGIVYSAEATLDQDFMVFFSNLAKETHELLVNNYGDESISHILKEHHTLRKVVAFYELLKTKISTIKDYGSIDEKVLLQEKQDIVNKIKGLENEKDLIINSEHMKELNQKIESFALKIKDVEKDYYPFGSYSFAGKCITGFINNYGDLNKYIGLSFWSTCMDGFLEDVPLGKVKKEFNGRNKLAISTLESYFKTQGYDVEVDSLKNPAQLMIPIPWVIPAIFGAIFPVFRNMMTSRFIGRKMDFFDWIGPLYIELVLGTIFFDGAFPLMYPLRVLGLPFILEPIRALTGMRDLKR